MKNIDRLNPKQLEAVQKVVDELIEKNKVEDWEPQQNDTYFYFDGRQAQEDQFYFYDHDNLMLSTGNFFRTEQEAESYGKRLQDHLKVKKRIKELNGDWVADFNKNEVKYYLYIRKGAAVFSGSGYMYMQDQPIYKYIKSEEVADQIQKEFTEEELTNFILTSL